MNCIKFTKINTMKKKWFKDKRHKEIWQQKIESYLLLSVGVWRRKKITD